MRAAVQEKLNLFLGGLADDLGADVAAYLMWAAYERSPKALTAISAPEKYAGLAAFVIPSFRSAFGTDQPDMIVLDLARKFVSHSGIHPKNYVLDNYGIHPYEINGFGLGANVAALAL